MRTPLACPRCATTMTREHVQSRSGERKATVDWCGGCGGIWLDQGDAEVVCPTFAKLEQREVEIVTLGNQATISCPRCQRTLFAFVVLEVEIDYCGDCRGLWLDRADAEGHIQATKARSLPQTAPYRAIHRAVSQTGASCVGCGEDGKLSDMHMTASGLACRQCYGAALSAHASRVQQREMQRIQVDGLGADSHTTRSVLSDLFDFFYH